jgi:hypothetical protein
MRRYFTLSLLIFMQFYPSIHFIQFISRKLRKMPQIQNVCQGLRVEIEMHQKVIIGTKIEALFVRNTNECAHRIKKSMHFKRKKCRKYKTDTHSPAVFILHK